MKYLYGWTTRLGQLSSLICRGVVAGRARSMIVG